MNATEFLETIFSDAINDTNKLKTKIGSEIKTGGFGIGKSEIRLFWFVLIAIELFIILLSREQGYLSLILFFDAHACINSL